MRPTRLELEGFASFRDRVVVDFEGADLFVLTGPTGSGKSSLIDAITFVLYGAVSRYGHKAMIAPVITQGRLEAKVMLDFVVEGVSYRAVRVVRRTKTGATTREARLERGSTVLAGSPDDLTEQVERLVGLPFDHFTRCVVLPQGEFARFLHDEPSDRQGLLVKLLDLEVYGRMATAANVRAKAADERIGKARERLERDLAYATPEARQEASATVARLETLARRIDDARPRLEELGREAARLAEAGRGAAELAKRLDGLAAPVADLELAQRIESERCAVKKATGVVEEAAEKLAVVVEQRKKLPDPEPLRETLGKHRRRAEVQAALDDAAKRLEQARQKDGAAERALEKAKSAVAGAQHAHDTAVRSNLAAALAADLSIGDPCPVCGIKIKSLPHGEKPKGLEKAKATLESAKLAEKEADTKRRDAHAMAERLNGEHLTRTAELTTLTKSLAKAPDAAAVEKTLNAIRAAEQAVAAVRDQHDQATAAAGLAGKRLRAAQENVKTAWQRLDQIRDVLIPLGPPVVDREDLGAAWDELQRWARGEAPRQRTRATELGTEAKGLEASMAGIRAEIAAAVAEAGLDPRRDDPRAVCSEALAAARETLRGIEAAIEEAKRLRAETREAQDTARVAHFLAQHLGARHFESWVLNRVMRGLAVGASQRLLELSRNQYSFELDERKRGFMVVDHWSANEVRLARTLSGGETFLASLALALALSEHVSRLAAHGAARLDALFIDEGFGALDPESLDVVATAIEGLRDRGHMVGIVTHVPELAERIPVRFVVTKDAGSSRVRRVAQGDSDQDEPWRPEPMAAV